MHNGIENRLLDFVQTVTTDTSIATDTDLVMNDHLDSLLLMDLVIFIESETGVSLDGDEIAPQNFRTIASLAKLVDRKSTPHLRGRFAA